ncbi:MAG: NUDIX domain-containing protein [Desulfatitalea sp.]
MNITMSDIPHQHQVSQAKAKMVFSNHKYLRWKKRVEDNGNRIHSSEVLAVITRNEDDFYGALLDCELTTPEKQTVKRCVLIRGDCVVIVPVLRCRDDGKIYTLLVEQRRIIDGGFTQEFPAGMLDCNADDPRVMASRELREELNLDIAPNQLKPLSEQPVKIISSLVGDLLYFYYFEMEVTADFLNCMEGRPTGCHHESEYILVRVREVAQIANHAASSTLIGVKLLERALRRTF